MAYSFRDDYSEGAHPEVMAALLDANHGQQPGYGLDDSCALAQARIRDALGTDDVDVHFVVGGTQANRIVLQSLLAPYEAVIAAESAHINVHETGAIESTGHRIVTCLSDDGKLTPSAVEQVVAEHQDEHRVRPAVASIAQATELGTVYSGAELAALAENCHRLDLAVFLDGARLAMALAAAGSTLTLRDLVGLGIDAFTIGATKNGALCGEAIVLVNPRLRPYFRYAMKQNGALVAKGRLLGAQFARMFAEDGLWFDLGRRANASAARLADGLDTLGIELVHPCTTNQVFALLPRDVVEQLQEAYSFLVWAPRGPDVVVRLVCSWATPDERVDALLHELARLTG